MKERKGTFSSNGEASVQVSGDINRIERFKRVKPLLSSLAKGTKKPAKVLAAALAIAATAIAGSVLGTKLDYVYNNYDYSRLGNQTGIKMKGIKGKAELSELEMAAVKAATLPIVGKDAPQKAALSLHLVNESDGTLSAHADYEMVWPTNRGTKKEGGDYENVYVIWKCKKGLDGSGNCIAKSAFTRYHYRQVEFQGISDIAAIVIQNPAHTPGIPGANLRHVEGEPGIIDTFTMFSATKWAGFALWAGFPQAFYALPVAFETEVKVDARSLPKTE